MESVTMIDHFLEARRTKYVIEELGEVRNAYNILVGKPEWKRPLGRLWRRIEDNISIDLREKALEGVSWIHLAVDRDY
jgi:hypothetical protein